MALRNLSIVMRQKASDLPEDRLRNIEAGLTRAREVKSTQYKKLASNALRFIN